MEVAITFSPGWCFGGFWVPPTERSKMLTRAWVDVSGPGLSINRFRPMCRLDVCGNARGLARALPVGRA